MNDREKFNQMLKWFEESDLITEYNLDYNKETYNTFCHLGTKKLNVRIFMSSKHDPNQLFSDAINVNGKIAFENENCYDKLTRALPAIIIPDNRTDFDNLMKLLEYVGSEDYQVNCPNYDSEDPTLIALYKPLVHLWDEDGTRYNLLNQ